MKALLSALAALSLAACASAPVIEHITVDDSSAGVRSRVRVLSEQHAGFSPIQAVAARSCRQMAWDPDASETDAIAQLQIKAARLGANALASVRCDPPVAATVSPNCWKSIVCHGVAGMAP